MPFVFSSPDEGKMSPAGTRDAVLGRDSRGEKSRRDD
jgi:hypothetical protein